ncbi:MAG: ferredoxin family protein [Lentisphaeria bacterium]|nr:ferredoxin family protein [Lentisphaeria bacterium]
MKIPTIPCRILLSNPFQNGLHVVFVRAMECESKVLYCNCAFAKVIDADVKADVLTQLKESGIAFEAVEDLCSMAANIAACYPRAVKGLFKQAEAELSESAEIHNMRLNTADDVVSALIKDQSTATKIPFVMEFTDKSDERDGEWLPWFPVIDYDRCTNCMQCLSFCLFGVYGVDEEKEIQVQNQNKCKTNCPACSRVCPEAAIMFPKYKSGPVNGEEVSEDDMNRENMKIDISSLLGGDIYSTLRDRHKQADQRFAKERDDTRALNERMRCLKELQDGMDIPKEVLMALPSREEIKQRAIEAKEAGRVAREESIERRLKDRDTKSDE